MIVFKTVFSLLLYNTFLQRTVEEITIVTTEIIVVEDAAPEEDLTQLQTVK